MQRGIWRCSRCKRHWGYNVDDHVHKLDKICHGCGMRNRGTIWRQPGRRGRDSTMTIRLRPSYMPLHAIQEEVKRRNAAMGRPRKSNGFMRATELKEFDSCSCGAVCTSKCDGNHWRHWNDRGEEE